MFSIAGRKLRWDQTIGRNITYSGLDAAAASECTASGAGHLRRGEI